MPSNHAFAIAMSAHSEEARKQREDERREVENNHLLKEQLGEQKNLGERVSDLEAQLKRYTGREQTRCARCAACATTMSAVGSFVIAIAGLAIAITALVRSV